MTDEYESNILKAGLRILRNSGGIIVDEFVSSLQRNAIEPITYIPSDPEDLARRERARTEIDNDLEADRKKRLQELRKDLGIIKNTVTK